MKMVMMVIAVVVVVVVGDGGVTIVVGVPLAAAQGLSPLAVPLTAQTFGLHS